MYVYVDMQRDLLFGVPEEIQERRTCCEDKREAGWDFWRRRARRITVPETAMAVARTTPCEQSIEDMVDEEAEEEGKNWIKRRICCGVFTLFYMGTQHKTRVEG